MFNKIDAWSLPANAIQIVKLFNFVRTFITCNLDITNYYVLWTWRALYFWIVDIESICWTLIKQELELYAVSSVFEQFPQFRSED